MKSRLSLLAALVLVTIGLTGAPAQASGERVIWQATKLGYGTVQVWYSNEGYNWVSVSGATGRPAEAGIYSGPSGWKWSSSYLRAPSRFTTPPVYAPGSTCVIFKFKIIGTDRKTWSKTGTLC